MTHIFISYARENRAIAKNLATKLGEDGWDVFWDRRIEAGTEWNEEIQRALQDARCVIVLWSADFENSLWVAGEAANAFARDAYLPLRVDESEPPRLFRHVQAHSIAGWVENGAQEELDELKSILRSRIGDLPMYGNLERVAEGYPVHEGHIHLVHSCWRVDRKTRWGLMPYRIHLIVFGHRSALSRIELVEYLLPGYPAGYDRQMGGPRERLFELKELANGFCIAQAMVRLRTQPLGTPKFSG